MIRGIIRCRINETLGHHERDSFLLLLNHNSDYNNIRSIRKFSSVKVSTSPLSLILCESLDNNMITSRNMDMTLSSRSSDFLFGKMHSYRNITMTTPIRSSIDDNSNNTIIKHERKKYIPRKAAVKLTDNARDMFTKLLNDPPRPEIIGIMLNYDQSKSGEPRMVYNFQFVTNNDINYELDEGVSLEMIKHKKINKNNDNDNEDYEMIPKSPIDSEHDGLPKLFIHHNAFLKLLGSTVDVDKETMTPILYDREGNLMDPNA